MKFGRITSQSQAGDLVIIDEDAFFQVDELSSFAQVLQLPISDLREIAIEAPRKRIQPSRLLAPLAPMTEIWGAGVTYPPLDGTIPAKNSVLDVYSRVYHSPRPELFFKGTAWRVAGPHDFIGVRYDAQSSIPEPEIALVVNALGEHVGLTLSNDVTARDIEAENPLYLSQAKIYLRSSALGPFVTPMWEVSNLSAIEVSGRIVREGQVVWEATTSFGRLCRSLDELVDYLVRCQRYEHGVVLSTGAGIWPPDEISLREGDRVHVWATTLGELINDVRVIPVKIDR